LGLSNDSPQSTQQKQQQKTIINSHATTTPGLLGSGRNTHLAAGSNLCIVKPIRGVASEQVYLCPDLPSVEKAFHQIYGTTVFGSPGQSHDTVLVQEFAYGTEYALDTVSRDGQHKVAALWRYDKRPANGASFVYHATELIEANESELARTVCDYAMAALDALDLKWGTTHTEVILTTDGPRLVEVNCRQHNMDFAPLTMAGIGYNVMDMLLESYLGGGPIETVHVWDDFPTLPSIRAHAAMVHLVNHASGKLVGINGEALNEIQRLESVLELKVYPSFLEMGNHISPTVDIRSDAGWVQLINDDEEAFQRDYNRILELMPTLFVTDEE
jgi:predicted ATP-grasp superfamily ATP-dependent carboligase